jgi:hypothetical protein
MAINYPTSLDTFTNPTATSLLTSPSHAQQHSDINDAVEALEAKVAIGNTVLGTYTAYTPSFNANLTVGNGTLSSSYCRVNNYVHYWGKLTFGSTTVITAAGIGVTLPINLDATMLPTGMPLGLMYFNDVSTSALNQGDAISIGIATQFYMSVDNSSSTYSYRSNVSPSIPFTWTVSDIIFWNLYYKAA